MTATCSRLGVKLTISSSSQRLGVSIVVTAVETFPPDSVSELLHTDSLNASNGCVLQRSSLKFFRFSAGFHFDYLFFFSQLQTTREDPKSRLR